MRTVGTLVTPWTLGTLALSVCLLATPAAQASTKKGRQAPPSSASPWREIAPGGQTLCALGDPFSFFVHEGDPSRVVIDFLGGGACWDSITCGNDGLVPVYKENVEKVRSDLADGKGQGVLDLSHPENPYRGWTHVVVPYCTGDIQWGAADVEYEREDGDSLTIHHRGAANTTAVLDWVRAHYQVKAKRLMVHGCSAGAYASIYWAPRIIEDFPQAVVRQLGDSGAGVPAREWNRLVMPRWNVTAHAPKWIPGLDPSRVDYGALTLSDFYVREAAHYPAVSFAQFNHAHDAVQRFFLDKMGGDVDLWHDELLRGLSTIKSAVPTFRAYTAPGTNHCVTTDDEFYELETQGVSFKSWLKSYAEGAPVPNVACEGEDCEDLKSQRQPPRPPILTAP